MPTGRHSASPGIRRGCQNPCYSAYRDTCRDWPSWPSENWLYYPGSATGEGSTFLRGAIREISAEVGHPTFHPDDWESVQIRVHADGSAEMRASAHYGYGDGWQPVDESSYTVSGGSHAGTVEPADFGRITTPRRLELIPLEPIAAGHPETEFAITPPWYKRAWTEPEYGGTD